jgi:hypothetical protein
VHVEERSAIFAADVLVEVPLDRQDLAGISVDEEGFRFGGGLPEVIWNLPFLKDAGAVWCELKACADLFMKLSALNKKLRILGSYL